jgi:hypothetical protein
MQAADTKDKELQIGHAGYLAWLILVIAILLFFDFGMPATTETSDFVSCLWTGAKLILEGRAQDLYTPATMTTFQGAPADIAAHQWLKNLPPGLVAAFNYCPLVAFLLVPFALLPPNFALFAWHVVSLLALFTAISLLCGKERDHAQAMALCFLFFPTIITIWIGQTDLVFGVLFMAFGAKLLMERKDYSAGMIAWIALLKPQFAIVLGLVSVALLRRRWKFAAGIATTVALLLGLNVAVGGISMFEGWLRTLKLCEAIFTNPTMGLQKHLMVSLPGNILHAYAYNQVTKPLIYLMAACVGSFGIWRCWKAHGEFSDEADWIRFCFAVGVALMPFMIPNFMLYDLPIFLLPALLIFGQPSENPRWKPLKSVAIALVIAANTYLIVLFSIKAFALPLLLVSVLGIVLIALLLPSGTRIPLVAQLNGSAGSPNS